MLDPQPIERRTHLADMGRGAFALAVVAVAGCLPTTSSASPDGSTAASTDPADDPAATASGAAASAEPTQKGPPPPANTSGFEWERVNLGFVSAYILVRGGEAVVVDTGVAGSVEAIEASLVGVGLDWSSVGHLILTHHHRDHVGSVADVMDRAPDAVAYAGAEDIASITLPRPLTVVRDGNDVFGLTIITTPGHTPGSISVLDPIGGFLVAGDALRTNGGTPALPGADFTADMDQAIASIVKLGGLAFETLLVGHGEPIDGGASQAVAALGSRS